MEDYMNRSLAAQENYPMTDEQHQALREIAEFMKDIVNASDGDEPYTSSEIFEIGMELLNNLSATDYMLGGEK